MEQKQEPRSIYIKYIWVREYSRWHMECRWIRQALGERSFAR